MNFSLKHHHAPYSAHRFSAGRRHLSPYASGQRLLRLGWLLLLAAIAIGLLAGCNRGQAQSAADELPSIREPKPTFTPTAGQVTGQTTTNAQPEAGTSGSAAATDGGNAEAAPAAAVPAVAQPTGARVIVSDPLVNVRSGPGLNFEVVAVVERGEEFDITGRSNDGEWWQICCTAEGVTAWIINQLVDTNGPVDSVPAVGADAAAAVGEFSVGQVKATVNIPLLNARGEANTNSEVVSIVEAGQQFDVLSTSTGRDWWQVCCVEGREAWLADEFVDLQGPAAIVPIFGQGPAPARAAPASMEFALLSQEQFAETGGVRIFLFVTDANDSALGGYSLRITKDGQSLPIEGVSFGGQPGFTWPFQDARQRPQNFKAELPGAPVGGAWTVELVDEGGRPVGPAATFELAENDPNQELYVRYERQ